MKKIFQILILLTIANLSFGQEQKESFWKKYIDEDTKELKLEELNEKNYPLAVRIWTDFQMVELINKGDSLYEGQLINYVTKVNRKEEKKGLVSQRLKIPEYVVKRLIEELSNQKIKDLPDSYKVEGYINGLDGITYIFEVKSLGEYRIYSYWSPESDHYQNPNIEEVKRVRNILTAINKEFNLRKSFARFRDGLPIGRYRYGGIIMKVG
jgi:hypothetical protein